MEPLLTNQVLAQCVINDTENLEDRGGTDSQSVSTSNDLASQVFSLSSLLPPQDDGSSCDSSLSTLNPIQAHHVHNNNPSEPCICPNGFLLRGDIHKVNGEPDHNVPLLIPSIIDCSLEIASSQAVMIPEAEPLMHHDNQDSSLSEATCKPHKAFSIEDAVIEFQDASEHPIDPEIGHKEQELYFFDTSDDFQPCARLRKAFHLSLDYESFL